MWVESREQSLKPTVAVDVTLRTRTRDLDRQAVAGLVLSGTHRTATSRCLPDNGARAKAQHRSGGPYNSVKVPAFMGAGAVSVNVLDVVVFCPSRARLVPKAVMWVTPDDDVTVPEPWAPPLWV